MSIDVTALARRALLEITPESTIGAVIDTVDEADGAVSVLFANRMAGYPGWRWVVSVGQVADEDPTVLEVELMPGEGALVAPDWVPWSERLAEYRAAQENEPNTDDDPDADDDFDDADEDDLADDEDDLDGVEIDAVEDDAIDDGEDPSEGADRQ